ncbi:MAG: hypothetical protein FWE12_00610 [Oscillospiraceae bacterium]|nr:hypothetical protein [Oscillospiraceae bacterium]
MTDFATNINIQTLIGLFFLVLCFVLAIVGYLLWRFRFLDGKQFYFSESLGVFLMVASSILAIAAILMLLYVRVTL